MSACPHCGHALSEVDEVLLATDSSYQCRNCWNIIRRTELQTTHPTAQRKHPLVHAAQRGPRRHVRRAA